MKRTIKSYKLFESKVDESKIHEFFELVRSNFQELEDMGIVLDYNYGKNGVELRGYPSIRTIGRFYGRDSIWYKSLQNETNCIIINLKLPINENDLVDQDGIRVFDDILSINSRLSSDGYRIEYDMSGNHGNYKPMSIILYYNL